jgi:hypothetical protein
MGVSRTGEETKSYKKFATAADYTPFLFKAPQHQKRLKELPPCTFGQPIIDYLNSA